MSPSKDTPPPPGGGKIAIKGFSLTAKPSSAASKSKPAAPPSSILGKRPRATFQHDSESEDERDGGRRRGGHEAVTGFGEGGAIHRERDVDGEGSGRRGGELVIKKMANRDWRGEARSRGSGRDLLPPEARAEREAVVRERDGKGAEKTEGVDVVNGNDGAIQWGLSVRKRTRTEDDDDDVEGGGGDANGTTTKKDKDKPNQPPPQPKTADEEALASLLGQQTSQSRPVLTIPITTLTEQEAYKAAVASAPDVSSLEDYERIPVEEFGAALLRGMGWKGEKTAKPKDIKRRQNLLGLGAKELDGAEELGAWVQKSDTKRLNPGSGKEGGRGSGDRRPKAGEYKREKERERERREERGGGGYRREKEREREGGYRDSGRDRHREYRR
ncbi:putative Pre-mRNA-splicing factor SPP2 [Leptodontidium sp. MPI-SDFR-AT-0119]|nr:putative Pre-mRNA-splicing factor SPP2 [Leptodontidium sp. MPI-SDFR-AT-0119]